MPQSSHSRLLRLLLRGQVRRELRELGELLEVLEGGRGRCRRPGDERRLLGAVDPVARAAHFERDLVRLRERRGDLGEPDLEVRGADHVQLAAAHARGRLRHERRGGGAPGPGVERRERGGHGRAAPERRGRGPRTAEVPRRRACGLGRPAP